MTPTTEQLKDLLAKVTTGPWRVEQGTTLIWGACNPDDTSSRGMGYPIAEARITPISISSWARGPYADEGQANATLIALAPTLAAEVVRLREALEEIALQDQFNCRRNGEIVPEWGLCGQIARQSLDATSDA